MHASIAACMGCDAAKGEATKPLFDGVNLGARACAHPLSGSIVVSITACHAVDPGSIPGRRVDLPGYGAAECICILSRVR